MEWYRAVLNSNLMPSLTVSDRRRILIIEDDLCLQHALGWVIKDISPEIEVRWATTGDEVASGLLNRAFEDHYDLVIADVRLPGNLSGLDLWRASYEQLPSMRFLLMSGMATEEYLQLISRERVAPAFLPKPFTVRDCSEKIRELLSGCGRRTAA